MGHSHGICWRATSAGGAWSAGKLPRFQQQPSRASKLGSISAGWQQRWGSALSAMDTAAQGGSMQPMRQRSGWVSEHDARVQPPRDRLCFEGKSRRTNHSGGVLLPRRRGAAAAESRTVLLSTFLLHSRPITDCLSSWTFCFRAVLSSAVSGFSLFSILGTFWCMNTDRQAHPSGLHGRFFLPAR